MAFGDVFEKHVSFSKIKVFRVSQIRLQTCFIAGKSCEVSCAHTVPGLFKKKVSFQQMAMDQKKVPKNVYFLVKSKPKPVVPKGWHFFDPSPNGCGCLRLPVVNTKRG